MKNLKKIIKKIKIYRNIKKMKEYYPDFEDKDLEIKIKEVSS